MAGLTGTIVPREDRPRSRCRVWELVVNMPRRGKLYPRRTRAFHGTYREAQAALHEFIAECERPQVDGSMSFAEYAGRWSGRRAASGALAPSTVDSERYKLAAAVMHIGDLAMGEVTREDVEDCYSALLRGESPSGRRWTPKSVEDLHKTLATLFNDAVRDAVIASAPHSRAKRPRVPQAARNVPTADSVDEMVSSMDLRLAPMMGVALCAYTGLRREEACALEWADYDGCSVLVSKAMGRDGSLRPTKSGRPRTVPVPASLRPRLDALRSDGRMCPLRPDSLTQWWTRHRSDYGMECRLHDLRHAYLTRLAEAGVHPRTMMELAGHGSIDVCMGIYTHVRDATRQDAVESAFSTGGFAGNLRD